MTVVRFYRYVGLALAVLVVSVPPATMAQENTSNTGRAAGEPLTVGSLDGVSRITIPAVDREAVRLEDQERERQGLAPRYAIPNPVRITPATDGTWDRLDDGTLRWRVRVDSTGATSINVGFTRYGMPPGGSLTLYAADGGYVIGPFTDADNETHRELWTPPVLSDDVVVELTLPESELDALDLVLGSINVGYRGFGEVRPDKSGSCNVDVVCPQGDGWRDQIQSVGVISTGGSTFCTGFMVNNTAYDLKPYFMTANHCSITSGNAASLVVFWNYQNSWCRAPGSPASGQPGDGQLNQYQTGSYFRASYSSSDFTLVELDDDPNPDWNVVFAGWDRSTGDSTSAVGIHHPNTDEKRISFEYAATTTTSYLGTSTPGDGTHVRIIDWDLGTTEPGSSGSPLFNQDHRIVGQLHGGYAACGNNDSDWYGRFSKSWTGGATASTRLSNWLDAGNTGAVTIDHLSSGGMSVTPGDDVLHIGDVGGPFTNPTVTYTLTNPTPDPVDYSVSLTASFGILLDGSADPVTGTLAALGGTVDVVVSLGPDIDALAAGTYVEDVLFQDLTNTKDAVRRHTVEVGQTLITVEPEEGFESGGPEGGPFLGSIDYTVTSERPTPVQVEVSADAAWIELDGGTGPLTLNLNGTGVSDIVTIGFGAVAESLSPGLYTGVVSFTNLSGGEGDTTRTIILDVGRVVYPSTDTPKSIADYATVTSTIVVPDDYCIGDLNVDIDITHTYIGDLIVELKSPTGVAVRLHNRTGGEADNIIQTYDDDALPPDGPGALADYNFARSAGTWTLTVSDNASSDTGTLNGWALRIAPYPGGCPTPQLIYSFPLDENPGWSTAGQWAFGTPTGGGSYNHDPTSGYTGPYVYGYNLSGDYPSSMSATQYLTMPPLDLSGYAFVQLRVRRWLGVERNAFDHATMGISTNGNDWSLVWENPNVTITDSTWSYESYHLSPTADQQTTVYLRWGMGPTDGSVTYPGWNLDDIEIWGVPVILDCNHNGTPDDEDILGGTSEDCNENAVPDECDVDGGSSQDCNGNAIPDECDIADATSPDCNGNAVPDECDLDAGTSDDCNGNEVPDECECVPSAAPAPETYATAKVRYLSFVPGNVGCPTALQVTFVDLPAPFDVFEGESMWVGAPRTFCENAGQATPPGGGCGPAPGLPNLTFSAAALQCAPHYVDWGPIGNLHVYHAAIVPGGVYEIRAIHRYCDPQAGGSYSPPLSGTTSVWGDLVTDCTTSPCGPPDGIVGVSTDVTALLDKYKNLQGAPAKTRCDIDPAQPDQFVNITDVTYCLDAFRGAGYPYVPGSPPPCP